MWVRQLIGRHAGQIIEMAYPDGMQNIANGTAEAVSERELEESGKSAADQLPEVDENALIVGYQIVTVGVGFDVLDAGGVKLNDEPLRNQVVAREVAIQHAMASRQIEDRHEKSDADVEALRAVARDLAIKVDGRWSKDRIETEIAAARKAKGDPSTKEPINGATEKQRASAAVKDDGDKKK